MWNYNKYLGIFFLISIVNTGYSQSILSMNEAIELALENNYQIKIARNDFIIDKNNNTHGNAGFLPELALNFGQNFNINNTKQEFFNGDVRNGNNVKNNNFNTNLLLNWTVFDGLRMFVNKDRLTELERLGEINLKLQVENTIAQVMSVYLNIDQIEKRIQTIQSAIEVSKERLALAKLKKDIGSGSGLLVLQAEVDINADSSMLINQNLFLKNTKVQLNELLARAPETEFITSKVDPLQAIDFSNISEKAEKRNSLLQIADKNVVLSQLSLKQWETNKYPTIDVNVGYNFSRLNAEIGILKFNQNAGLSFGLTGRWNLFNGWNNKREIQIAKLGIETSKLAKDQTMLSLKSRLYELYNNYITFKNIASVEEKNISIAQQNLDITTDKMKIGTIGSLDLRQAQLNLVEAKFRKITAEFEAQINSLEMLRLSGELIK